MKNNKFFLPTALAAVLFLVLLCGMILQICLPAVVLPPINIPNIVLLSVVVLLIDYFVAKSSERCYVCVLGFGLVAFGVLPLMAGFACVHDFWKIGLVGGVTFTVTAYLFTSVAKRIKTGRKAPSALIVTGFGMFLASQCFAGILL